MRRARISAALAALLLIASLAAPALAQDSATSSDEDEYAEEEKAFLIVRKSTLHKEVVVGSNLTVVIEIHNAGQNSAFNVELQDILPPSGAFTPLSGSPSAKFERIAPGATERHSYSITPKASGVHRSVPATVTYKADSPTSTDQQVAYSTESVVSVLTLAQNYTRFFLKLGKFATLGAFTTVNQWLRAGAITAVGAVIFLAYFAYTNVTEGAKRKRYQRALEDVAKMK